MNYLLIPLLLLHPLLAVAQEEWPLPHTTVAEAGFSAVRLQRLHAYCEEL